MKTEYFTGSDHWGGSVLRSSVLDA